MRRKESLEYERIHTLKTLKFPVFWILAVNSLLCSCESALLCWQLSASEVGAPSDKMLDPYLNYFT